MSIITFLSGCSWVPVPVTLCQAIGAKPALMFAELCNEHSMHVQENTLNEDGSFPSMVEFVESRIGLSIKEQRSSLGMLIDAGLVAVDYKGVPPVRQITINEEGILQVLGIAGHRVQNGRLNIIRDSTINNNIYIEEKSNESKWLSINKKFISCYGYQLAGFTAKKLLSYMDDLGEKAVEFAVDAAIERKVKAPAKYIFAVCENLVRSGVHDDDSFDAFLAKRQKTSAIDFDNSEDRINRIASMIAIEEQGKEKNHDN